MMKRNLSPAWDILSIANTSRKLAREKYAKHYGRSFNATGILNDISQQLQKAKGNPDRVLIPVELLVALALRPRGNGKGKKEGRPKKEVRAARWYGLAIRKANSYWAAHIGLDGSKAARQDGAQMALDTTWFGTGRKKPTLKMILRDMRLENGKRGVAS